MKVGAAYIRVSSDDQMEYSPDSQLKVVRDYAKREGYVIPDEYVYQDDGISGKSASKRPAFRLMIATAKEKEPPFESIFVWKFSRFARNQEEAIMYKNLLKKKGITVKSVSEPSSDSPFSSLIERIIEWMDEYYLINLSSEVRRGMKEKAARGEALYTAPYGYRVKDKVFVEQEEEARIVRYIFDQFISGKGIRSLAVELGEIGVRTRRGKPPDYRWVQYILGNQTYIGKIRWSEEGRINYGRSDERKENRIVVDGQHRPVIDTETWDKAQSILKQRDSEPKYVRKKNPSVFMLKGLVRCDSCGATLTHLSTKSPSIQCHNYAKGKCHVSHCITLAKANDAVVSYLETVVESGAFQFAPVLPQKKATRDWDKLIASEEKRLVRAKNALLDGAFTTSEYKDIKREVEDNIVKLTAARDSEKSERSASHVDPSTFKAKVMDVLDLIKSPDVSESAKNQAMQSIIEKVIFNKPSGTFDIYFAP